MISVILATKNGSKYIDRAIESVLKQKDADFELIIISDGSTDNTVEKATRWSEKDSRTKVIVLEKNIGPGLARDKAIRESLGEYVAIIDDDDFWISDNKLSIQKTFLDNHTKTVLIGGAKTRIVDEQEKLLKYYTNPVSDKNIRRSILIKNNFMNCTVMFRKEAYIRAGGFKALYLAEDYDLWLRMGQFGQFSNIEGFEVAYTERTGGASKQRKLELYRTNIKLIISHKKEYPHAWLGVLKSSLRIALFRLQNIF